MNKKIIFITGLIFGLTSLAPAYGMLNLNITKVYLTCEKLPRQFKNKQTGNLYSWKWDNISRYLTVFVNGKEETKLSGQEAQEFLRQMRRMQNKYGQN